MENYPQESLNIYRGLPIIRLEKEEIFMTSISYVENVYKYRRQIVKVMNSMDRQARTPIKIALIGMDERSQTRMSTIFKIVYKGRCEAIEDKDANLAIVDLDGQTDVWEIFQKQYPNLPSIVMSESPTAVEGAIYIAKPAKLDLLWESILRLVTGLPSPDELFQKSDSIAEIPTTIARDSPRSPPDISTSNDKLVDAVSGIPNVADAELNAASTDSRSVQQMDEEDATTTFFNPDDYLLGRILSSLKECTGRECSIHVQCSKDHQLILIPGQGIALTDLTDSQFDNMGMATLTNEFTIETRSIGDSENNESSVCDKEGLRSTSIDYLLWDLAQRTARGRVPIGTPLSKPLYLQCWPNFPRLPHTPQAMRIASMWVGEPRTLNDIARSLGIDQVEVYSFYSAAFAIGLAGTANRQSDDLITPRSIIKKDVMKRELRNAILRHVSSR